MYTVNLRKNTEFLGESGRKSFVWQIHAFPASVSLATVKRLKLSSLHLLNKNLNLCFKIVKYLVKITIKTSIDLEIINTINYLPFKLLGKWEIHSFIYKKMMPIFVNLIFCKSLFSPFSKCKIDRKQSFS